MKHKMIYTGYRILYVLLCMAWTIGIAISAIIYITLVYWLITGNNIMDEFDDWIDPSFDQIREKIQL